MNTLIKSSYTGFTLAELLIALLILAEIATFTIPKLISTQQMANRKSIFRETYAALSGSLYTGVINGQVTSTTDYWTYLQSSLNALKFCTNAATGGCWSGATDNSYNTSSKAGILLHNGAMITDFDFSFPSDNMWIDWNGTAGPNMHCVDQIPIVLFAASDSQAGISGQAGQVRYRIDPPGVTAKSCASSVFDAL